VDILVAEDDSDAAELYRAALEARRHKVTATIDGQQCLNVYQDAIRRLVASGKSLPTHQPFDAVILDYKIPKIDGLEVAKEMLRVNPNQRIIFASAYTKSTLADAIKELKQVVELIQKPFEPEIIVEVIEHRSVVKKLEVLNADIITNVSSRSGNSNEINVLLERLKKIQKEGTIS
jgi:CheY-like chemotaxis protein